MSQTKDWRRRRSRDQNQKICDEVFDRQRPHGSVTRIEIGPINRTSSCVRPLSMPSVSEIFYAPIITVEE
ncbi:MAG: hypothetical protein ACRD39_05345 [Nitrososphaeraceae archaeon]